MKKILVWLFLTLTFLATAFFLITPLILETEWFAGKLSSELEEFLGEPVLIDEPLELSFGREISIGLNRFSYGKSCKETDELDYSAKKIKVSASPLTFFSERLEIEDILVSDLTVSLCDSSEAEEKVLDNSKEENEAPFNFLSIPIVRNVSITNTAVIIGEKEKATKLLINELQLKALTTKKSVFAGKITYAEVPFEIKGTYDIPDGQHLSLSSIVNTIDEKLSLKVAGQMSSKEVELENSLNFKLHARSINALEKLAGTVVPLKLPISFSGKMAQNGSLIKLTELVASINNSKASGEFSIDTSSERLKLIGDLHLEELYLEDFESSTQNSSKKSDKEEKIFTDEALPFSSLAANDVKLKIRADKIGLSPDLLITKLLLDAETSESELGLFLRNATVFSGIFTSQLKVDSPTKNPSTEFLITARGIDLGVALGAKDILETSGELDVSLDAQGNTTNQIAENLNGKFNFIAGKGQFNNKILDLLTGTLSEMFKQIFSGEKSGNLNCVVSGFNVVDGVLKSSSLLFDSNVLSVDGSGFVNLREEKLDLHFSPSTYEPSLASLVVPFSVEGSLAAPEISVDLVGSLKDLASSPLTIAKGTVNRIDSVADKISGDVEESLCSKAIKAVREIPATDK